MITSTPLLLLLAGSAFAQWPHRQGQQVRGLWHLPAGNEAASSSTMGNATFTQLIDHSNPSLGTFEQWYMYDTKYWKGPGSPIVLFTPGEVNASLYTHYLTKERTTGVVAEKIGAATIVLEHRYWGYSSPYDDLTTANLQYLTLANAIADLNNFAANVALPFDSHGSSNAANAPWVMMGASYSGALAAWTATVSPGTIWAYAASSAPVEAVSNYWGYFLPVQQGMPKNCSTDVNRVIVHMDNVMKTGSTKEKLALKTMFGLEKVEHDDDFMAALEWAPWLWQGNQFYANSGFFDWCDYIENSVNQTDASKLPGPDGVGLQKALKGYAEWSKAYFVDFCQTTFGYFGGGLNTKCLDSYNVDNPMFTDMTLSNTVDRQWVWMTCNEPFGYWQNGAPTGHPTLVSRYVNVDYWVRQCGLYFPPGPNGETYGLARGIKESSVNAYTTGWSTPNTTRLLFINGQFDPWRESGVSSDLRPSGPLQSSEEVPVLIVPGGFHGSDMVTENGEVNAGAKGVIDAEVAQMVEWVKEWPGAGKGYGHGGGWGGHHGKHHGPPPGERRWVA